MNKDVTLADLKQRIVQVKAKLVMQASKKGISENFGLKEEREISSMAQSIIHDGSRPSEERDQASKLDIDFYDWVTTYSPGR